MRLFQHVCEAGVEGGKVAVVVEHRPPQHALGRRGHKARHRVVPDGRVLRLALGVHLQQQRRGRGRGISRRLSALGPSSLAQQEAADYEAEKRRR